MNREVLRPHSALKETLLLLGALLFVCGACLLAGLLSERSAKTPMKAPAVKLTTDVDAETITFDMGGDAHVFHLDDFECHAHGADIMCEYNE